MERGREGRRGGAGGAPVSAPRRPRTSGFKDAPVGEDGDDMMEDIHNPRLRERPKKDSSSVTAVQGIPSGSVGSASRNKRKRQGSQEVQGQARSITADDLDETTEETEMCASEDDDDPPPPPIPRRIGKLRPQVKVLEDGSSADLPAVPRKARTAILKRPQESSSPVVDATHQGSSSIPRTPAPVNTPSSSSLVSLKPGRRMKPSSSKPRAAKVHKVLTPAIISEQEVEVAEALFDLARMFTSEPTSSTHEFSVEPNPESKPESKPRTEPKVEIEVKYEPKVVAKNITAVSPTSPEVSVPAVPAVLAGSTYPSAPSSPLAPTVPSSPTGPLALASAVLSSPLSASQSSTLKPAASSTALSPIPLPALSIIAVSAGTASPVPSPTPATAPPAEAPKRKRPRVKMRPEEMGIVSQVRPLGSSSTIMSCFSGVSAPSSRSEFEQILTSSPQSRNNNSVRIETGSAPSTVAAVPVTVTSPFISLSALDTVDSSSSATTIQGNSVLEKPASVENKAAIVEINRTASPLDTKQILTVDRKAASTSSHSPPTCLTGEMELAVSSMPANESLLNLEFERRSIQQPILATDGCQPDKFNIDLMAPPLMKPALSPAIERTMEVTGKTAKDVPKKGAVDLQAAIPTEASWIEGEKRETRQDSEIDQEAKEEQLERKEGREWALEREKEHDGQREHDREREMPNESSREKEWERVEPAKQPTHRPGKTVKVESRIQKADKSVSANAASASSSFLSPASLVANAVTASVSSSTATLPVSVGMGGWSVGLPPMGYYSPAGPGWPGTTLCGTASVDENNQPAVQLQHPYIIQARQPQPWKRCASHVYIAHFIDVQQQMSRHPFIQAAYQNSTSVYGAKPYNLNIPLPPADTVFGNVSCGSVRGGVSSASVVIGGGNGTGLAVVPGGERSLGSASQLANSHSKDRVYMEPSVRKQTIHQQQQSQLPPNIPLQSGTGVVFPATQAGPNIVGGVSAASVPPNPNGGGSGGNPVSASGAALVGMVSGAGASLVAGPGSGASTGGVASHAAAHAQYLQAVMQQGGFPFPFQAATHFGPGFSGPPGHIGPQQAAQFFSNPFYTTHLMHAPSHTQQQLQQSVNLSGGLTSGQKQHAPQQVVLNFPPSSQQQQTPIAPPAQSCHSQQQHLQGSTSQQMQRPVDREANNGGENNSTAESKFSMLQRNMFGQGNPTVAISTVNPASSSVLGVVTQSMPPQDFNLIGSLGAKQSKHQQLVVHHHTSGPALQMSLKGIEQQSSQSFPAMSMAAMNRASTVGPGPLGLAPVAAVMAPQGHALLQSMADPNRGHTQHQQQQQQHHQSLAAQSHQHSLQASQQQLQRAVQMQRPSSGASGASGVEDGRIVVDGTSFSSRSGREAVEDRKVSTKRGIGATPNLSRVDLDSPASIQGSPTGGGLSAPRMTGNVGPTLNLMTPPSAILISRSAGHPSASAIQHPGPVLSGNQNSKQAILRSKLLASSGSASSSQSQLSSFSDRAPLGPSLSNKVPGPPLSLSGQSVTQSTQVQRQSQVPPHSSQLKLSNRGSVGSLPTPSGTAPQAVLAAAIAKSQQGPPQQQSRQQIQVGSNPLPPPRLPSVNSGGAPTSSSIPFPPLPPATKSVSPCAAKIISSSKGSFALSHKPSSGISGKRPTPSGQHAASVLVPGTVAQSLPLKSSQQQQQSQTQHHLQQQQHQNPSQHHPQQSKQPSSQSLLQPLTQTSQSLTTMQQQQQQFHQQQSHLGSQQLHQVQNKQVLLQQQHTTQMQRHMFLQNPAFQHSQQAPGSPLNSHPQQQQTLHQQSQQYPPQQMHHQTNSPSSQPQQHSTQIHQQSHLQHQQQTQVHQHQQHNMQGSPGLLSTAANGSLSLGPPTLTLGTGSNANNSSRSTGPDSLAASQGPGSRSNPAASKGSSGSGIPLSSSNSHRSHSGGPSFLHSQFGSSVASGQQQSSSPRTSAGPQYLQPVASSGASTKLVEQKVISGPEVQEQVNGMRLLSTSSPSRIPQMSLSGSPGLQPMSIRSSAGGTSVGKSMGGQFAGNSYSEGTGSRSGLMLSVAPPNLSSNNSASSNMHSNNSSPISTGLGSSVHLGTDGRPLFGGSSSVSNQAAILSQGHSGSGHQSSLLMASGTASSNAQTVQPGVLGQTPTSVVQP